MARTKKTNEQQPTEVEILKLQAGRLTFRICGTTPLIYSAMSLKVKQGLLYPHKKTMAERAATVKHNPFAEFTSSVYKTDEGPTLLCFPAVAFKRGLASAALDLGGAKKAQIERLVWAIGERVPIWGIPELRMDVVRSADMNRTPDIRTRAILRSWCAELTISYVRPALNDTVVANLLASAGLIRGIGDFRQEKGAGNYGQFSIENSKEEIAIMDRLKKEAGRKQQERAMIEPQCFDDETRELLLWWEKEVKRRGHSKSRDEDEGEEELNHAQAE